VAASELVAVKPALSVAVALHGWVRFYRPLVRHRRSFVVAAYEEVTRDFGAVVRLVNERFGTVFAEPDGTHEVGREIAEATEAYWRGREGRGLPVLGRGRGGGPVPTEPPEAVADRLRAELASPRLARSRARAGALHRALMVPGPPEPPEP
jgi:hypothetical protein